MIKGIIRSMEKEWHIYLRENMGRSEDNSEACEETGQII